MSIFIAPQLKEICEENQIVINFVCEMVVSNLPFDINLPPTYFELGYPGNSHSCRMVGKSFQVLIDPIALVNVQEGRFFALESLYYEIAHEMGHAVVSNPLKFIQKFNLQMDMYMQEGISFNKTLNSVIQNTLENIRIDKMLVQIPLFMRGFYFRQDIEYERCKEWLKNPDRNHASKIIAEFLGVCRRAIVAMEAKETKSSEKFFKMFNTRFGSQINQFFKCFNSQYLKDTWQLMKEAHFNDVDKTYEINENLQYFAGIKK